MAVNLFLSISTLGTLRFLHIRCNYELCYRCHRFVRIAWNRGPAFFEMLGERISRIRFWRCGVSLWYHELPHKVAGRQYTQKLQQPNKKSNVYIIYILFPDVAKGFRSSFVIVYLRSLDVKPKMTKHNHGAPGRIGSAAWVLYSYRVKRSVNFTRLLNKACLTSQARIPWKQ